MAELQYLILSSAEAGCADEQDVASARAILQAVADVDVVGCCSAEDLERVLKLRDDRIPIVAGGDGSLHHVLQGLHDRGELQSVPVGLLPMGTGNDFARSIGLPLDMQEAARALLAARLAPVDLAVDDTGRVLVNAGHVGVGAAASESAGSFKKALGPVGYRLGSLIAGLRSPGWPVQVEVDGEVVTDSTTPLLMAALGNGRMIGGGGELFPGASLDDGLLEVMVSTANDPGSRTGFATDLQLGRHLQRPDVVSVRGRSVTFRGTGVPMNVDGELLTLEGSRTWRVRQGGWTTLVPVEQPD